MKKEYKFYNRYGLNIRLEQIEGTRYALKTSTEYVRYSPNEDGTINFVDPEGGPFFEIGLIIGGICISNITDEVIDGKNTFVFDICEAK